MKRFLLPAISFVCFLIMATAPLQAQKMIVHDSSYFEVYPRSLTVRLYGIHKYQELLIPSNGTADDIKYRPNTKSGLGAGVTYKNFTLNGALNFGFLNNDEDERGETKSFDLHVHAYPNKWAIDALGIFHKHQYISPKEINVFNPDNYYLRPDVKSSYVGLAAYRIANSTRFSYRAAMLQNEWQKKSAGSVLFGGGAYYFQIKGDSSLVPYIPANSSFRQTGIDKITVVTIGPGIGYAYTLVAGEHIFLMGSVIANANVNFTKEYAGGDNESKTSFEPYAVYKAGVGYNSSTWAVSANWTGTAQLFKGTTTSKAYFIPTGWFMASISKKIELNK